MWLKRCIDIISSLILIVAGVFVLWILMQVFVFTSFRIPSDSMSPILEDGDRVLVWKPAVGARIFNLHRSLNQEQTAIYRIPGFRPIKHNDVVVFNTPYPNDGSRIEMHIMKYNIKRCIGLPGDTLSIHNGVFCVNNINTPLGNLPSQKRIGRARPGDFPPGVYNCFPYDSVLNWNIQNLGPLYIPKAGDELTIARNNGVVYCKLIEWETGAKLRFQGDTVLINDSIITSYRFLKNYYFVAGDNGENSRDSRYWGLLPEEYIVGVASRIWKSVDRYSGEIRWNRVWKKIE